MRKVYLVSDLHVEFMLRGRTNVDIFTHEEILSEVVTPDCEGILIVAGDLGVGIEMVRRALYVLSTWFYQVIYVPGNHEYYGGSIKLVDIELKKIKLANVFIATNKGKYTKIIDDTLFIARPLWANIPSHAEVTVGNVMNDFKYIQELTIDTCNKLYHKQANEIVDKVIDRHLPTRKIVVTHFGPAEETIHPIYGNFKENLINHYFNGNLGPVIKDFKDTTWVFGHTHSSVDVTIGTTRCVSNPYGYYRREVNPEFKKDFTI